LLLSGPSPKRMTLSLPSRFQCFTGVTVAIGERDRDSS
jgi:hypothetical protein